MKIFLSHIYVDDQDKALQFYTDTLGFVKKEDVSNGGYRWLTVVSPENQNGAELLLELNNSPAAKAYQQAIFGQGMPATIFEVADLEGEYTKLAGKGVAFKMPPTDVGPAKIAMFEDGCGNILQLKG